MGARWFVAVRVIVVRGPFEGGRGQGQGGKEEDGWEWGVHFVVVC